MAAHWLGCRRLNVSRRRVIAAPRLAASRMSRTSSRRGSPGTSASSSIEAAAMMVVSTLLKSCARPPANRPTVSIFSACRRRCSSARRSVTSSKVTPTSCSGKGNDLTEKVRGSPPVKPGMSDSSPEAADSRRSDRRSTRSVPLSIGKTSWSSAPTSVSRSRPARCAAAGLAVTRRNSRLEPSSLRQTSRPSCMCRKMSRWRRRFCSACSSSRSTVGVSSWIRSEATSAWSASATWRTRHGRTAFTDRPSRGTGTGRCPGRGPAPVRTAPSTHG